MRGYRLAADDIVKCTCRQIGTQIGGKIVSIAGKVITDVSPVDSLYIICCDSGAASGRCQIGVGIVATGTRKIDAILMGMRLETGIKMIVGAANPDLHPYMIKFHAHQGAGGAGTRTVGGGT